MGGVGSTLQGSDSYAMKAAKAKELPNQILKEFFSRADFKDLLSLSSLEACPMYLFSTAEALSSLFQRLQVFPAMGKKGEILFAPLSQISPGSFKTAVPPEELITATAQRNNLCMYVAYFYIRIFQIYSALALTVMDTNPSRKSTGALSQRVSPLQRSPSKALFVSGGGVAREGGSAKEGGVAAGGGSQKGGKFQSTGEFAQYSKEARSTPFQVLEKYFMFKSEAGSLVLSYVDMTKKFNALGKLNIEWPPTSENTAKARFFYGKVRDEGIPLEITINLTGNTADMIINGTVVASFVKHTLGSWLYAGKKDSTARTDNDLEIELSSEMYTFFTQIVQDNYGVEQISGPLRVSGTSGVYGAYRPSYTTGAFATTGKSAFQSLEDMKRILISTNFPKAYCIARAMTLMDPIFSEELSNPKAPYQSLICRRSHDFDPMDLMPRAGKSPATNIYFRSLTALYYDDFQIVSRSGKAEVIFKQTETGRSELRKASVQVANLYYIETLKENFLESSNQFRDFGICKKNENAFINIQDPTFRSALLKNVVLPMLDFQQTHTAKVNALLGEMFEVNAKGEPKFKSSLAKGGIPVVNQFAKRARDLLLDYYLRSEAYYNNGVSMMEKNLKALSFTL